MLIVQGEFELASVCNLFFAKKGGDITMACKGGKKTKKGGRKVK